jgi:hypothetical protein
MTLASTNWDGRGFAEVVGCGAGKRGKEAWKISSPTFFDRQNLVDPLLAPKCFHGPKRQQGFDPILILQPRDARLFTYDRPLVKTA